MTNVQPSSPQNCAPFVPVLKADAADLLRVSPKTIDNYIAQGLLPKPTRFGMREMWHPDVFYAHLGRALLGDGSPMVGDMPEVPVETAEPRRNARAASKPDAAVPIGAGRLSRRLAEINQRHAA